MAHHAFSRRNARSACARSGFVRWLLDRRGVSSVEYAVLLVAILLIAAGGYRVLGKRANDATKGAEATIRGEDVNWKGGGGPTSNPGGGGSSGNGGGVVCDGRSCNAPGFCFAAGTLVATPSGARPIESLREGDVVLSRAEVDGALEARPIARTFVRLAPSLVDVRVEDVEGARETVRSTPEHPYFTLDRGWTAAGSLVANESLLDSRGREVRVARVEPIAQEAPVYNLEVEADHTYFVGHSALWVHNTCGTGDPGGGGGGGSGSSTGGGGGGGSGSSTGGGGGGGSGSGTGGGGGGGTGTTSPPVTGPVGPTTMPNGKPFPPPYNVPPKTDPTVQAAVAAEQQAAQDALDAKKAAQDAAKAQKQSDNMAGNPKIPQAKKDQKAQDAIDAQNAANAAQAKANASAAAAAAQAANAEPAHIADTLGKIDPHNPTANAPPGKQGINWGTEFTNKDGDLPAAPPGTYHEYRVPPAFGDNTAGDRRIVINSSTGDAYYTNTHYGDHGPPAFTKIRDGW